MHGIEGVDGYWRVGLTSSIIRRIPVVPHKAVAEVSE